MFRIFLILLTSSSALAQDKMIAWWPFENDFRDASGAQIHGRPLFGAGFDEGRHGRGLKLNGTSAFVSVPDNPAFHFGTGSFTLALWIHFPITGRADVRGVLTKGKTDAAGSWGLIADGAGLRYADTRTRFLFPSMEKGWQHIAVVRTAGTYSYYHNGKPAGKQTPGAADLTNTDPLMIGRAARKQTAGTMLDDIKLFGRALNRAELQEAMEAAVPKLPAPSPAVARKDEIEIPINRTKPADEPIYSVPELDEDPSPVATPSAPARPAPETPAGGNDVLVVGASTPQARVRTGESGGKATLGPVLVDYVLELSGPQTFTNGMVSTRDGGVIAASSVDGDMAVMKHTARDSKQLWRSGGPSQDAALDVALSPGGILAVTGYAGPGSKYNAGGQDVMVARLDLEGRARWVATAGGSGDDRGQAVAVDRSGRIFVAGTFSGEATFGKQTVTGGEENLFLACYDTTGKTRWVFSAGDADTRVSAVSLTTAPNGRDLLLVGRYNGNLTLGNTQLSGEGWFLAALSPLR
ncbi:MAG: LamG domain-containing protein [Acidobacteriota bacterium]|nr:LamG domain-containing protein [Acidobacteriota bacterium]